MFSLCSFTMLCSLRMQSMTSFICFRFGEIWKQIRPCIARTSSRIGRQITLKTIVGTLNALEIVPSHLRLILWLEMCLEVLVFPFCFNLELTFQSGMLRSHIMWTMFSFLQTSPIPKWCHALFPLKSPVNFQAYQRILGQLFHVNLNEVGGGEQSSIV